MLYNKLTSLLFSLLLLLTLGKSSFAQCAGSVPTYTVDFTGNPDSIWSGLNLARSGLCCGHTNPDRCLQFVVTMDPQQEGISLTTSGAIAFGSGGIELECL